LGLSYVVVIVEFLRPDLESCDDDGIYVVTRACQAGDGSCYAIGLFTCVVGLLWSSNAYLSWRVVQSNGKSTWCGRQEHLVRETVSVGAGDCSTWCGRLYHLVRETVSLGAGDCITWCGRLYHLVRETVSLGAGDCISLWGLVQHQIVVLGTEAELLIVWC
jgi:hypothetical protein